MTDTPSTRPQIGDEEILSEEILKAMNVNPRLSAASMLSSHGAYKGAALAAMSRLRASLPQPTAQSTGEVDDASVIRALRAWGTRYIGDDPNSVIPAIRAALEAAASTPAQSGLVEALHKIANPFDHGHCGTCGKECAGATDCGCAFPVWEQDNPIAIARVALSHAPSQPAPAPLTQSLPDGTLSLTDHGVRLADKALFASSKLLYELPVTSPQPDRESEVEVTDEAVERACSVFMSRDNGLHEDMRAAIVAAFSPTIQPIAGEADNG